MRKFYASVSFTAFLFVFFIFSCSRSDDDDGYVEPDPVSPVVVDLTQVPYQKLSDYHFFGSDMKTQTPSLGVLPYAPSSSLFTDYAHKKRFVWMPEGTKATYNTDGSVLELPTGAVLIKTFYYENVQNVSVPGSTRIIETRLMIKKSDGWIFANYVWNDEQTEAFYDMQGSFTHVEWVENGTTHQADYKIPNLSQCIVCHKSQNSENGSNVQHIPIGIKPQNLNFDYNYGNETKNQLAKWVEAGYLDADFTPPTQENSVVDYNDPSKSLELRVRSYFDSNCSHCHMNDRHCDYRPMRFAYHETGGTNGLANMGVCVNTMDMQDFPPELNKIVSGRKPEESMLFYRVNTTNEAFRMPLHGRTVLHVEGVSLIEAWINSLENCE
ncbi:hypothetical protein [Flavobacterium sp.]|uniref:hypothetical protein n=1 Tax=Flavobacterium sp. TaxID=239 RepID=UPI001210061F|nr:hypothetical protein [Flavobacterium sp.]RZJ70496.1 MAG: hypothetical protein EOO49_13635 [Flavobacterium sp.]